MRPAGAHWSVRVALVLGVVGSLLRLFSLAFIPPILLAARDAFFTLDWQFHVDSVSVTPLVFFVASMVLTLSLGSALASRVSRPPVFYRAEALAVAAGTWFGIGVVGAIPFVLFGLSPYDALFESVSGFTTTGATILTDFSAYPRPFFLWRAMSQWFGGLGVIALFVVVLPRLGIAGRQIFFAEASGAPSEAVSAQARGGARKLWMFYAGLTALQAALFMIFAEWGLFDAVVHSLTTLAAGGFSPNGESIMGYASPAAEWIFIPFMFIAGASYPLMFIACTKRPLALFRDGEFLFYAAVTLITVGLLTLVLESDPTAAARAAQAAAAVPDTGIAPTLLDNLRTAAFQITSLISSAGFASVDYEFWSDKAKLILFAVMVLGGCAGSAAGGAKEVRFLLTLKFLMRELTRVLHPRAVLPLRYRGEALAPDIVRAVFTLVFLYLAGYFVVAVPIMLFTDVDLVEGFGASVGCLSNVGPAFGRAGPMGSYAHYPDPIKAWLTFTMLLGRLEIVTMLALFHPHVWRNLAWKGRTRQPRT